jgi:ankyrin repeat protein
MKKTNSIATFLVLLLMPLLSFGMEQDPDTAADQNLNWYDLPQEMQQHALSFVLNTNHMIGMIKTEPQSDEILAEYFRQLVILKLIDKNISGLVKELPDKELPDKELVVEELIKFWMDKKDIVSLLCFLDQLAKIGLVDMLKLALNKGVQVWQILLIASRNNNIAFCKELIESEPLVGKNIEFEKAIYLHQCDRFKALVGRAGDDVCFDSLGMLKIAIECEALDIIKWLLEIEDIKLSDGETHTALGVAAKIGNIEVMRLLIDRGAEVNERVAGDMTPLKMASIFGKTEAVRFLLEKGAVVDGVNSFHQTPLMLAASQGRTEIVKCLIENGAKINCRDKDRMTALMSAAQYGRTEVVKYLVEKNANVNAKNKDKMTALMIASEHGHIKIVHVLLLNNAKFVGKALSIAQEKGHQDIIGVLENHLEQHGIVDDENSNESDDETPENDQCIIC